MAKQFSSDTYAGYGNGVPQKCYHSHPPLKIGDTGLLIYGGSCSSPVVQDADIYIGFDYSMTQTEESYPWQRSREEIYFHIQDGSIPKNAAEFKKMISWVALQLQAGKKVHAGCIGGHGRTGLFLSALVKHMTGIEDSTTYVRENYCKKAVESQVQVDFLEKQFGIKPVAGSKAHLSHGSSHSNQTYGGSKKTFGTPAKDGWTPESWRTDGGTSQGKLFDAKNSNGIKLGKDSINPVPSKRNIWATS